MRRSPSPGRRSERSSPRTGGAAARAAETPPAPRARGTPGSRRSAVRPLCGAAQMNGMAVKIPNPLCGTSPPRPRRAPRWRRRPWSSGSSPSGRGGRGRVAPRGGCFRRRRRRQRRRRQRQRQRRVGFRDEPAEIDRGYDCQFEAASVFPPHAARCSARLRLNHRARPTARWPCGGNAGVRRRDAAWRSARAHHLVRRRDGADDERREELRETYAFGAQARCSGREKAKKKNPRRGEEGGEETRAREAAKKPRPRRRRRRRTRVRGEGGEETHVRGEAEAQVAGAAAMRQTANWRQEAVDAVFSSYLRVVFSSSSRRRRSLAKPDRLADSLTAATSYRATPSRESLRWPRAPACWRAPRATASRSCW